MTTYSNKQKIKWTDAMSAISDGTLDAKAICGTADCFPWIASKPTLGEPEWLVLGDPYGVLSKLGEECAPSSKPVMQGEEADYYVILQLVDLSIFGDEGFSIQVLTTGGPTY